MFCVNQQIDPLIHVVILQIHVVSIYVKAVLVQILNEFDAVRFNSVQFHMWSIDERVLPFIGCIPNLESVIIVGSTIFSGTC